MSGAPHVAMTGGHLTFVQDWAKVAADLAQVTLFTPGDGEVPHGPRGGSYARVPLGSVHLRPSRVFRPVNVRLSAAKLGAALRQAEAVGTPVTHLHSHFYAGSEAVVRVARRFGLPLVHTEHSSAILQGTVSPSGRRALLDVCEEASVLFAVSDDLADAMRSLGVDRAIEVVPNPVDLELFRSPTITASYPPRNGRWEFVSVGWLIEGKNHATIVRAFAAARGTLPGSRLTILGEGVLQAELSALAASLGVSDSVRFPGRRTRQEISEVLAASHVFVHASRSETFGVALVEAWGAGLPVVTFDCGGVASLADEIGGVTVVGWEPSDLAEAMVEQATATSVAQRMEIGSRARERFGTDVIASHLRQAYGGS